MQRNQPENARRQSRYDGIAEIDPDFAGIVPISDFISVDLPMPFRPTIATISPG